MAVAILLALAGVATAGPGGSGTASAASASRPASQAARGSARPGATPAAARSAGSRVVAARPSAKRLAQPRATTQVRTAAGTPVKRTRAERSPVTRSGVKRSGPKPLRTSCSSVAHIGDSTSVGIVSPDYLPDPAQRLAARYADVGVKHQRVDASGGRSIVEVLPDQVNGYNVARAWRGDGYRGCWVFALGTNDTANVSVGSDVGLTGRVERMMSAAHGEPVLWVNTRTNLAGGPWSEANMQRWNNTLLDACARYPNLRIFNWSAAANPAWYISDGIHYTSAGYAARARDIANALARAFPSGGHSHRCLVS